MANKLYTAAGFAKKFKLSRATVWRWMNKKHLLNRFKMYDAAIIKTADGKLMIEVQDKKAQLV